MLTLEWTEIILMIGITAIVPLGLAVVAKDRVSGVATPHLQQLRALHPFAAVVAVASFGFDSGLTAGLLTVPWLAFTLALAAVGVARRLSRANPLTAAIGIDAGLTFIAVGGGWLTMSRLGLNPMGFDDVIVRLTAVHFHFAGFALPIVAGAIARPRHDQPHPDRPQASDNSTGDRAWMLPAATIIGVPLTAIGIIVGGRLEWVAATTMALVGLTVAARMFATARWQADAGARWLLTIAGTALSIGMALAITYAWFVWFNIGGLPIDRMARTHGSLNAFGFGLVGLVGLLRSDVFDTHATNCEVDKGTTLALRWGGTTPAALHDLPLTDLPAATEAGVLALPRSRTDVWTRPIEVDRFEAAADAIRAWAGHDAAGITRQPAYPEIENGTELAMTIPAFWPFAVTATCRIVDVIDEQDRFGFTYATLPHHIVEGVETFLVVRERETAEGSTEPTARVEVTAHWRPLALAAWIAPPVTRFLQGRAIERYLEGIATAGPSPQTFPNTAVTSARERTAP